MSRSFVLANCLFVVCVCIMREGCCCWFTIALLSVIFGGCRARAREIFRVGLLAYLSHGAFKNGCRFDLLKRMMLHKQFHAVFFPAKETNSFAHFY